MIGEAVARRSIAPAASTARGKCHPCNEEAAFAYDIPAAP
jgi:hypothetical protein